MAKQSMTKPKIDFWLACTNDKMLKNCVAKVLKLFQRQPKFGRTLICLIYSLVKSINKCYYFKTTSRLQSHAPNKNIPPDKHDFGDFPSKDASCFWSSHTLFCHMLQRQESLCFWSCFWSSHTLSCHAFSDTICSKDKNVESYNSFPTFWDKKWNLLFTVTIHLSLFTDTIHCYYSPVTVHSEILPI